MKENLIKKNQSYIFVLMYYLHNIVSGEEDKRAFVDETTSTFFDLFYKEGDQLVESGATNESIKTLMISISKQYNVIENKDDFFASEQWNQIKLISRKPLSEISEFTSIELSSVLKHYRDLEENGH